MTYPRINIYPKRIEENARAITDLARQNNIGIYSVTKATCANIEVAKAMLAGGVEGLADSRLLNLMKLRSHFGADLPLLLLRLPMLSEAEGVVRIADLSLNSEMVTIEALSKAATEQGKEHGIVLMVDLGDLREGLWPDKIIATGQKIDRLAGAYLHGLGTNLTCYGGILPTTENLQKLIDLATELEERLGRKLAWISGGNSSSLHLIEKGQVPKGINNLRIGETMLLGNDTALNCPFPGTRADAFIFQAELIEIQEKPSVPIGVVGRDAFGRIPTRPEDRGIRLRGILAAGEQDIYPGGLIPLEEGVEIVGASSDHLLVDLTNCRQELKIGAPLSFTVAYGSLLRAMTSPFVSKVVRQE